MFGRSYIAEERSTICSSDSTTDSRSYMVIARCNICNKRSKYIERSTFA